MRLQFKPVAAGGDPLAAVFFARRQPGEPCIRAASRQNRSQPQALEGR